MPEVNLTTPIAPQARSADVAARHDAQLRKAAESLEASFLAVMLGAAGAQKTPEAFGGGIGEEQFASLLTQAHATAIVKHGGIGLAAKIYAELKDKTDATR